MKLQIDTVNKTIKLEGDVNIHDLIKQVKQMLPNKTWREFTLETNTIINNWTNPIVVDDNWWRRPYRPWWNEPYYIYDGIKTPITSTNLYSSDNLTGGTFNVEI